MDFSYPENAQHLRAEFRAWLADNLNDEVIEADRHRGRCDQAFQTLRSWDAAVADAGWAAISWPKALGGRDAGALEKLAYAEEAARAGLPAPLNLIGISNIAPAIMLYGSEQQMQTLLPRMARSEDIWCQGMSEPDAGSDLASLRTRAVRDGEDFVINGQKIWTSLGHRADWCQLYVRTDPDAPRHQGISCLIVDMSTPGIRVRPLVSINGDADFAEIFFDDVRVSADAILGPLNGGWQVAMTTLDHERAAAAQLYVEMRQRLRDLVTDLGQLRDTSVLSDPTVQCRLGELAIRINNLEILCLRAVSAVMSGGDVGATASLAKSTWGEVGQDLAALGYELLGHHVFGGQWAHQRLSARALTIAGGTTQVSKNITAQRVLGMPRR
ncbi:acyl-CoA dehydrogenase family protein [Mycobacterium sp. 236(2023)]|uniref:acyl-CoA dehydrogenase family protein n=1 Tax=Mycobacterium sp. 236(2023) TaxID=3038163 RepID=UPI002414DB10|nr:acyl-CoA dehydrogenase family protein [Mycobacterium sp. 236(2023)]MDG4668175.1 acyl-CoA dehydrogenase family protein [Mycobacterium sp. 236(2023)]